VINIFNLFLVLLSFWLLLAYSGGVLSWLYIAIGFVASLTVSFIAWKIKIINKYSSFLFLNIGFYKHFLKIIFSSFFVSIKIVIKIIFSSQDIKPDFYTAPIKKLNNNELVLLINTINLTAGLLFIGLNGKNITIYAVNEKLFKKLNISKICSNLHKINDSRLV
jgi:multisubunit Na+/H+ antiporter MnhE subunit